MGPLLFTLYVAPIANVITGFGVDHAQYADDTQLYIALKSSAVLNTIDECFQQVHRWLDVNGLCLNPEKSEAIVIGTSARQRTETSIVLSMLPTSLFQLPAPSKILVLQ